MLVSASVASATLYYDQSWVSGTVQYVTVDAGVPVNFVYQSYNDAADNMIETDINLLFRGEADFPVAELLYDTSIGGTSGAYAIDTTGFTQGHYIIQGTANDLVTGENWTTLLEFFVYSDIVDTNNTPPYFLPIEHFVYDIATTTEDNVLFIADYARDADNDPLTYALETFATNTDIMDCSLYQDAQGTVACEFYNVGETSITIFANDGEFPTTKEVFFTIEDSTDPTRNSRPYFNNLESIYRFNRSDDTVVAVVDLATVTGDPDAGDVLSFALDNALTNSNVIDCVLDGSVLICELTGVGATRLDVIVSDGVLEADATIYFVITETTATNTAPYFIIEPDFELVLENGMQSLVDLTTIAHDDEDNTMYFTLIANAHPSVVDCSISSLTNMLVCTPLSEGTSELTIEVSDGDLSSYGYFNVEVSSNSSNAAPYFIIEPDFELVLENGMQSLVDLTTIAHDDEDNTMYFTLIANAHPSVVDCSISSLTNMLVCTPLSEGTSELTIEVSDGDLSSYGYFDIKVSSNLNGTNETNTAPELLNVPLLISENYSYMSVFVVIPDVTIHGFDADNDPLVYSIDDASTDAGIITCNLVSSTLRCQMFGMGTTSVDLIVSDGQAEDRETIAISITDSVAAPVAVITGPTVVDAYETFSFDGSGSVPAPGESIVKYQWTIKDASGKTVKQLYGKTIFTSLSEGGVYLVTLLVVDADGRHGEFSVVLTVAQNDDKSETHVANRNLQVNSIQIMGSGYETAAPGDDIQVYVTITNNVGYDLDNIKATFSVPDFGIRFKSKATSIDDGEKVTLSIFGYVPDYVESDVYYPEISVSAEGFHRAKLGYLEVREE